MTNKFNYRAEIDGLRAIAVIPVLFFHAGFELFGGGFVGVDIFFVISGYLITSIIISETSDNNFSIVNFYERRARRILPALFFMVLVSIPFSWLSMSPLQMKEFSASVMAIPLFISNFVFWNESGYFSTAAELKPLLHTWSLAVEEQFYLIFPIFIILFWKLGFNFLFLLIFIIALLSFMLSQFGANLSPLPPFIDQEIKFNAIPDFAFYLAPARAWELLSGSLSAFYLLKRKQKNFKFKNTLSIIGILCVFISILIFNKSTPFPGMNALLPVIGTLLIILFTDKNTFVGKILSSKFLVTIGLASYSIYLWHQPVFAYLRLFLLNHPSDLLMLFSILFSFFMGWISFKFIESPFRDKQRFNRIQIFKLSVSVGILIFMIGLAGYITEGFKDRFSETELKAIDPPKFSDKDCNWTYPVKGFPGIEFCNLGNLNSEEQPIVFYGDSHIATLTSEINRIFSLKSLHGIRVNNKYCGPIFGVYREENLNETYVEKCQKSNAKLVDHVKFLKPQFVTLLNRWTFRLYPTDEEINELTFDNKEGGVEYIKNYREYYVYYEEEFHTDSFHKKKIIRNYVEELLDSNLLVKLVYPVPEVGWNISKFNMNNLIFGSKIPEYISTDYQLYLQRNKFALEILDSIDDNILLTRMRPDLVFCNTKKANRCNAQINSKPLYYDSNHLSNEGAEILIKELLVD